MIFNDYVIASDFDGTITCDDTIDMLFFVHGNEENIQIEEAFIAGKASSCETMKRHFEAKKLSLSEYYEFLDIHIMIDPGFDEFLLEASKNKMPLYIISAGFTQGIKRVLGEKRLSGVTVYANELAGTERLFPVFANTPNCKKAMGPCGNCKKEVLASIKKNTGKKIIFIGDGLTDRCAAHVADIVFAKESLANYCEENKIPYEPYENFFDVVEFLKIMSDTVIVNINDRKASSGSRGNQRKWYKNGIWYKADYLGYEGLAEHACTCLLESSSINDFAKYRAINIREIDGAKEEVLSGCMSYDFGNIITGDIIIMQLPEKYNVWLYPTGSHESNLLTFCEGVFNTFGVNIEREMKQMLCFDIIVGNEDRILRNFGLQQFGSEFKFAPLFDHGLSLLSDSKSPERVSSFDEISFRPFGHNRREGILLLQDSKLQLNVQLFERLVANIPVYPHKIVEMALTVLRKSLEETEGKLWTSL